MEELSSRHQAEITVLEKISKSQLVEHTRKLGEAERRLEEVGAEYDALQMEHDEMLKKNLAQLTEQKRAQAMHIMEKVIKLAYNRQKMRVWCKWVGGHIAGRLLEQSESQFTAMKVEHIQISKTMFAAKEKAHEEALHTLAVSHQKEIDTLKAQHGGSTAAAMKDVVAQHQDELKALEDMHQV